MIRFCTFEVYCLQKFRKNVIQDTKRLFETVQGFSKYEFLILLVFYIKQLRLDTINIFIKEVIKKYSDNIHLPNC